MIARAVGRESIARPELALLIEILVERSLDGGEFWARLFGQSAFP